MLKGVSKSGGKRCSFCDAYETDVHIIIERHSKEVCICDQCVELCNDVLENRGILENRNAATR